MTVSKVVARPASVALLLGRRIGGDAWVGEWRARGRGSGRSSEGHRVSAAPSSWALGCAKARSFACLVEPVPAEGGV